MTIEWLQAAAETGRKPGIPCAYGRRCARMGHRPALGFSLLQGRNTWTKRRAWLQIILNRRRLPCPCLPTRQPLAKSAARSARSSMSWIFTRAAMRGVCRSPDGPSITIAAQTADSSSRAASTDGSRRSFRNSYTTRSMRPLILSIRARGQSATQPTSSPCSATDCNRCAYSTSAVAVESSLRACVRVAARRKASIPLMGARHRQPMASGSIS